MNSLEHTLPYRRIAQELPSRGGIFAVCFCYLFTLAPHFVNLPVWVIVLALVAISWRCLQNLGRVGELPKWLLIPLVLIGGVGVFADFWTIVGRDAGLALLTVMTSFKFLESRSHRDMLILVVLCYILIATHFLFSQSIFTATLMLATLIVITSTLISLNQRDDSVPWRERLRLSTYLVGLSIPLMLILFVLVPRVPGPLWGLTTEQRGGITGLSDHMSPGEISNLIRSNEVAFRVVFDGDVPPQNQLYWRGPVMTRYSGYRWSQTLRRPLKTLHIRAFGTPVNYTVTLEPHGERWLLALDIPARVIDDSIMTKDYQLISKTKINDLVRYSMESRLAYEVGQDESAGYLNVARQFPEDRNPRTIELGRSLAARYGQPEYVIQHVLQMFNEQEYVYTLEPPLLRGDTVDQFLFDTRRGFCEHYAGSFALIMRAAGIPSRIVTGYQGGEYNRVGNYLIVRQSDAHAWTEVWLQDRGWVRIDPTAAVSPSRIEQGLDDALEGEDSGFRIQSRNPLFGNLLYSWDNVQHSWNDWVLNYDQRRQMNFLRKLEIGIDNFSDMIFALVIAIVAITGLFWFVAWYREQPPRPPAYEIQFRRLQKKLARRGLERAPAEDSRAFLARVAGAVGADRDRLARIVELYNRIKYGRDGPSDTALADLRRLVGAIH